MSFRFLQLGIAEVEPETYDLQYALFSVRGERYVAQTGVTHVDGVFHYPVNTLWETRYSANRSRASYTNV